PTPDARPALEVGRLPLDRGRQPEVVQDSRPQLRRRPSRRLDGLVDERDHRACPLDQLAVRLAPRSTEPSREPGELEAEAGQRLAEVVVELARDAGPLCLADRLDARRERAQLLAGRAELFLVPL